MGKRKKEVGFRGHLFKMGSERGIKEGFPHEQYIDL